MTIELKPEQTRILEEALRQGRFQSMEEALDCAIQSIAPEEPAEHGKRRAGHKSLIEVFAPVRGLNLEFQRKTRAEAVAHIRELRRGNRLPAGVTVKDLINEGRA